MRDIIDVPKIRNPGWALEIDSHRGITLVYKVLDGDKQ